MTKNFLPHTAPGPPCCVYFPVVTHSIANIRWGAPSEPNGAIEGYRVGYRQKHEDEQQEIIDDQLGADAREYTVTGLDRNVYYLFSVTAKTSQDAVDVWGSRNEIEVYTIINRREACCLSSFVCCLKGGKLLEKKFDTNLSGVCYQKPAVTRNLLDKLSLHFQNLVGNSISVREKFSMISLNLNSTIINA